MNIAKINKCDQMTGNETMDKIIKLGHLLKQHIGVGQINLTDTSLIWLDEGCPINMSVYFILATGQSWYNRFDFKSKTFDEEFEHNSIIRSLTIKEYFRNGLVKSNKLKFGIPDSNLSEKEQKLIKKIILKSDKIATQYAEDFFTQFPELDPSTSIGIIFSYIKKNNILLDCVKTQNILLVRLINAKFDLLKYEPDLVYMVIN
jgi:hypothetical protein